MTSSFNGYRVGRTGGGGALNGFVAPRAKQDWVIGATVNVGFVRGLMVLSHSGGSYGLQNIASGKKYRFTPHIGLEAA